MGPSFCKICFGKIIVRCFGNVSSPSCVSFNLVFPSSSNNSKVTNELPSYPSYRQLCRSFLFSMASVIVQRCRNFSPCFSFTRKLELNTNFRFEGRYIKIPLLHLLLVGNSRARLSRPGRLMSLEIESSRFDVVDGIVTYMFYDL